VTQFKSVRYSAKNCPFHPIFSLF